MEKEIMEFIQKGYNNIHARWKVLIEHGEEENLFLQRSKEEATELLEKINLALENLGQMLEAFMMKLSANDPVLAVSASVVAVPSSFGTSRSNKERAVAVDEGKLDGNGSSKRLLLAQELKVIQNDHENVQGRLKFLIEREEPNNVRVSMTQILLQQQNVTQNLKDLILKLENEEATVCVAGPSGTSQTDKEEALKRVVNDDDGEGGNGFLNQMRVIEKDHDDLHKRVKSWTELEENLPTDVKEIHLLQESLSKLLKEFIIALEYCSFFQHESGGEDDYLEMDDLGGGGEDD